MFRTIWLPSQWRSAYDCFHFYQPSSKLSNYSTCSQCNGAMKNAIQFTQHQTNFNFTCLSFKRKLFFGFIQIITTLFETLVSNLSRQVLQSWIKPTIVFAYPFLRLIDQACDYKTEMTQLGIWFSQSFYATNHSPSLPQCHLQPTFNIISHTHTTCHKVQDHKCSHTMSM